MERSAGELKVPLRRRVIYIYVQLLHLGEWLLFCAGIRRSNAPMPHRIKRAVLRESARRYGTRVFVETGTYLGDMLAAMLGSFDHLYSIELSDSFYSKATTRFGSIPQVHLRHGDSAVELEKLVGELPQRALFWLDAHYSGGATARAEIDTPIVAELRAIFSHNAEQHVMLVDDARLFNGTDNYPTLDGLRTIVTSFDPSYTVEVISDIIHITPPL